MKCYIDNRILNFEGSNTSKIIAQLIKLNRKEILLVSEINKIDVKILKVLQSEGLNFIEGTNAEISIQLSENKKYKYLDSEYETLEELLRSITKLNRSSEIERITNETKINIKLNLDGTGFNEIDTGIGFFDHMLQQIARHGNIDLFIKVDGDLNVDYHHTVEDTGLVLGEAILKALGTKTGIKRYGFLLPMDDSITKFALDLGGRVYSNFKCKFKNNSVGNFPTELTEEFFKSLAAGLRANIYLRCKGKNDHHKIESMFKAFAKTLNEAVRYDERATNILPTTKGVL